MFLLRLVNLFRQFLLFFPSVFRPLIAVLIILAFAFIIVEIISSLWRLIGR